MSAPNPLAELQELIASGPLEPGKAQRALDLLAQVAAAQEAQAAALEAHAKLDARRVSGFTRRGIPPHQADVERQAVAEKWAYVNGYGVGSGSPGETGYIKVTREKKVAWIAKRLQLPVRRVRGYLKDLGATIGPYVRASENRETLVIVGEKCEACEAAAAAGNDACLEHATARRIFNAAKPEHLYEKPSAYERRARLRHAVMWRSGWK